MQRYMKVMTIVSDFSFLVPMSKDDPRLLEAQNAVLDAFDTCEPAGNMFVRSGESIPYRPARPSVSHDSPASLSVGSLCDCLHCRCSGSHVRCITTSPVKVSYD